MMLISKNEVIIPISQSVDGSEVPMDINLKKKNGQTIQLLTETNVADSLFPVGFSFLSMKNHVPTFGTWSVEQNYIGNDMLVRVYSITRIK